LNYFSKVGKESELRGKMTLTLSLTTKCNGQCTYCERVRSWTPKNVQMSLDVIRKLPKCSYISLTGAAGDAIFHDNLFEVIKILRLKNPLVHIRFTTNGSIGSRQWWEQLAELLGKQSVVGFAIDSLDRKCPYRKLIVTDQMTRMKWYKNVTDNIYWQFIEFDHNKHQIAKARKLAERMDIYFFLKQNRIGEKIPEVERCQCFDDNCYYISEDSRVHPCCYFATNFTFNHQLTKEGINKEIFEAYQTSNNLINLIMNDFETAINSPYFKSIEKYNKRVGICRTPCRKMHKNWKSIR
jgi:organic radical activating enzyme